MTTMHRFLDHLYETQILNRNGLSIMQEFLRVCERNTEFEDQMICKLASYIKQLSASDCYDLASRLLEYFKSTNDSKISFQYQSNPPVPIARPVQIQRERQRFSEHTQTQDKRNINQQQQQQNKISKQELLQKQQELLQKNKDWRWKIQVNDRIKKQLRKAFQAIKQESLQIIPKRQLSPQALKMSNHIKQQLNSLFDIEQNQRTLIKNNSIQKQIDHQKLSRNQSIDDIKWDQKSTKLKPSISQNSFIRSGSPNQIQNKRSNISSSNSNNISMIGQQQNSTGFQQNSQQNVIGQNFHSSQQQILNNSNIHSPSRIVNKSGNQQIQHYHSIKNLKQNLNKELNDSQRNIVNNSSIQYPSSIINNQTFSQQSNNAVKNLKESLNKEINDSNHQLKMNASDYRLNFLNLSQSFKLIHEQLESDVITNKEAIQMIDQIREKQYEQLCTFKPTINKENQYYEKVKSRDISNPYERLYKDGVEHKFNKSQILSHIKSCLEMKDCTFHPNLQKSSSKPRNVRFAGTLKKVATFSKENENQSYM